MNLPTAEQVRAVLAYDAVTGAFKWAKFRSGVPRSRAPGWSDSRYGGRVTITVLGRKYFAHRLAWLIVTGKWPSKEIDHRDGVPSNNRFSNLRDVSSATNKENRRCAGSRSKTGLLGVSPYRRKGTHKEWRNDCFRARITVGGRQRTIGYFDTAREAYAAYLVEKRRLHVGNTL